MKKVIYVLAMMMILCVISNPATGQDGAGESPVYKHNLGFGAGLTTGVGMSYRFMPDDFGVQVTFGPRSDKYSTDVSTGLSFLYKLVKTKYTNFYLYQGNHLIYSKSEDYYWSDEPEVSETTKLNTGLGIGVEFVIFNRGSLNFMTGYAGYDTFDRISLTGEFAVYFKF